MLARVYSGATVGLDGVLITVEIDIPSHGFPGFTIVGLPDKSVDEAKERVRSAIVNSGFKMPETRITVNLAPADIKKVGSGFDLPIALGILVASKIVNPEILKSSLFIGELSLEGELRKIPGAIALTLLAKEKGLENIFLPQENSVEASLIERVKVYSIKNLKELVLFLNKEIEIFPAKVQKPENLKKTDYQILFEHIKGQITAKRACEIAAAGFHNLMFKGPPGTGKTLLSKAFASILPPMEKEEILEVTKIYSVAGLLKDEFIINIRPFRVIHHTISRIGLVGGGSNPTPGEISLAHRGVLFLDEIAEFPRGVLEALRQPMEDGKITVSRAQGTLTFPSRFLLIAAMNPCPCGYLGHPKKSCRCNPGAILKYKKRISGPLIDRIDLYVDVPPVDDLDLISDLPTETSEIIRNRVIKAREKQKLRFKDLDIFTNSEMTSAQIKIYCKLTDDASILLKQAISKLSLSARSYFKTIKIAQTIADLKDEKTISSSSIAEALQFRSNFE